MEVVIAIVVALAAIYIYFIFWYVTLPITAIGLFVWYRYTKSEEKRKRLAEEERKRQEADALRRAVERDHQKAQEQILGQIGVGINNALSVHDSIAGQLRSAGQALDVADREFADHAFAPFWDRVEKAATSLAYANEAMLTVNRRSVEYISLARRYEGKAPTFPINAEAVKELAGLRLCADRLDKTVRLAQRDFQFSMIYEQRKTNQLLVAGFTSLGEAINDMSWRISDSITNLEASIDEASSAFGESIGRIESVLADANTARSDEAEASATRDDKALEMLDNLQRHRNPSH
jgi:hypothetical protein